MMEVIECDHCNGERFKEIGEYGWAQSNSPYQYSTPIEFIDNTMRWHDTCGKCDHTHEHSLGRHLHFCSYQCFSEWAEKNIPKEDKDPTERLKELDDNDIRVKLMKKKVLGEG